MLIQFKAGVDRATVLGPYKEKQRLSTSATGEVLVVATTPPGLTVAAAVNNFNAKANSVVFAEPNWLYTKARPTWRGRRAPGGREPGGRREMASMPTAGRPVVLTRPAVGLPPLLLRRPWPPTTPASPPSGELLPLLAMPRMLLCHARSACTATQLNRPRPASRPSLLALCRGMKNVAGGTNAEAGWNTITNCSTVYVGVIDEGIQVRRCKRG